MASQVKIVRSILMTVLEILVVNMEAALMVLLNSPAHVMLVGKEKLAMLTLMTVPTYHAKMEEFALMVLILTLVNV
jgi:hypothetical protein